MAASYWDSTQRRFWEFSKEQLAAMRQRKQDEERSLVQMYPLPEWRHLSLFFFQQLNRLGKRMNVRQQALATAQVYLKRFYCRVEIRRTNPYLVMATALYLACKTEECPQHIRQVVQEAKGVWPEQAHCLEIARLGECEFFMISELSSQLIVHAPYRTLHALQAELALAPDELAQAWSIVNDHYMTDLPLLYAPHVVAVTALLWVLVLQPTASSVPGVAASAGGSGVSGLGGLGSGGTNTPSGSGGAGGGGTAGSSSLPPPPLLLPPSLSSLSSLSALGPGSSTPGGTPGGGAGPGTPNLLGGGGTPTTAGVPVGAFTGMSSGGPSSMVQAQARAAATAAMQGGSATPNPGGGSFQGAPGSQPSGTPTDEMPPGSQGPGQGQQAQQQQQAPQDGGRGTTMQWLIKWLAESGLDMEATIDCTQELIAFYMCCDEYDEKQTREKINRFVKARGLDR